MRLFRADNIADFDIIARLQKNAILFFGLWGTFSFFPRPFRSGAPTVT